MPSTAQTGAHANPKHQVPPLGTSALYTPSPRCLRLIQTPSRELYWSIARWHHGMCSALRMQFRILINTECSRYLTTDVEVLTRVYFIKFLTSEVVHGVLTRKLLLWRQTHCLGGLKSKMGALTNRLDLDVEGRYRARRSLKETSVFMSKCMSLSPASSATQGRTDSLTNLSLHPPVIPKMLSYTTPQPARQNTGHLLNST